jgi:PAS domain S-box-containing protein
MAPTENLPAVLDSATNVIVVVNERRVCTYANAAVERLLGHRPATLVGEDLLGYVHSDDAPSVRATFDELVDTGRASTDEFRLGASDGSWLWFEGRFSPCGDRGGQYVVSATDISQRKALVTDRRRIERRLQQLTENTNNAL